jgi:hypothetical protein
MNTKLKNLFKFFHNRFVIKTCYILTTIFLIRLTYLEENQILKMIEMVVCLTNLVLSFKNVVVLEDTNLDVGD